MVYFEIAATTKGVGRISTCARMWPAWCSLIGIRATDKVDMRARAASVGPLDRIVEKYLLSHESAVVRAMNILKLILTTHWLLKGLILKSVRQQRFWTNSDMRARMWPAWYYLIKGFMQKTHLRSTHVHRTVSFDRDDRGGRYRDFLG